MNSPGADARAQIAGLRGGITDPPRRQSPRAIMRGIPFDCAGMKAHVPPGAAGGIYTGNCEPRHPLHARRAAGPPPRSLSARIQSRRDHSGDEPRPTQFPREFSREDLSRAPRDRYRAVSPLAQYLFIAGLLALPARVIAGSRFLPGRGKKTARARLNRICRIIIS